MKKIVYTVLYGNYELREPTYINKDWELICFSDRKRKSNHWQVIQHDVTDKRKESRKTKIRCDLYLDFDICLYLDAKFTVTCDLNQFVLDTMRSDLVVMKHNRRQCAYDEAYYCAKINKDKSSVLFNQIQIYEKEGFPKHYGLFAPGIMLRRNTEDVINFMKAWYQEIEKHSYRDIVSFPYVLWKNPIDIRSMPFRETYMMFKPQN